MAGALFHLLVLVLLPPLLLGVVNRTKSLVSGRTGPPLLQGYYDLARLWRKGAVLSTTTTAVFLAGPVVAAVTAVAAGLCVPLGPTALVRFPGDAVALAYLLALGRFFTAAAALDTGSAFEGMGAAREVSFGCLAEPVVFLVFIALARLTGSLELSAMLGPGLGRAWVAAGPTLALLAASLFVVLLAEACRIPFDDPNTHLELTMIHEVMVLDHSGPLFGLVLYGASVKFLVLGAILVRLVLPAGGASPWADGAVLLGGLGALAVAVGAVESLMARLRLTHVPTLLVAAGVLAAFGFLLLLR
ncbi:MAG: respiratory chain complex I subunit 1 family protein [Deferrisomatales bacterium]